jgi:hypothetical protein
MDQNHQPEMPAGWQAGAARVRAVAEQTDVVPAALFTSAGEDRR